MELDVRMKKHTCPVCGRELINLSTNPMIGIYWCDGCGWGDEFNKYDALTTEAKVRCISEYIFTVCPYDSPNESTIADIEDSIRIALEESERNGFTIDNDGMWYIYEERC